MSNCPQAVRQQAARRLAPLAFPGRRKCVRRAGKSPNVGAGLHRTNTVGHDPEDQNAETVTTHGLAVPLWEAPYTRGGRTRITDPPEAGTSCLTNQQTE